MLQKILQIILGILKPKPKDPPFYCPPSQDSIVVPLEPQKSPQNEIVVEKYLWGTKDEIRHTLRVIGDEYNMTMLQKDLLCDICQCESGFVLKARLENSPTSIDRGLFQWNSRWHPEITDAIAYDPEKATRLACKAILNKQSHAFWSASERCWNKTGKYTSII